MKFRPLVLLAIVLMLLTGCLSLARPGKQQRKEASARAAKQLAAHRAELEKVTYRMYCSDRPAPFEFSSHGDKFNLKCKSPRMTLGLATGISDDGYLLTAAHVVEEHCYVVGCMDGKPALSPARVVYKKFGREFGEEMAILHVDKHLDCPIPLGTLGPADSDIYTFACNWQPDAKLIIVAGKIIQRPEPKPGNDVSTMTLDAPLWKGDSGGAVLSREGRLVGVFVGVSRSLTTFKVSRVACVPDLERVQSIIEADRLKSKEINPAPEPTTATVTPGAVPEPRQP
jgi:hypothetical protein